MSLAIDRLIEAGVWRVVQEQWSDAARAASAAARRARSKGKDWRKAAVTAYSKKGGRTNASNALLAQRAQAWGTGGKKLQRLDRRVDAKTKRDYHHYYA